jgi:hypothetical protein
MNSGHTTSGMYPQNNLGCPAPCGMRSGANEWQQRPLGNGAENNRSYSVQDARWSRDNHLRRQTRLANQQAQVNARPAPLPPPQQGHHRWSSSWKDNGPANHGGQVPPVAWNHPPCNLPVSNTRGRERQQFQNENSPMSNGNHNGNSLEHMADKFTEE